MTNLSPMLCGLKKPEDLSRPDYTWERKIDGERATIEITPNKRFIYSRAGREKNRMYPDLVIDVKSPCILDGEIAAATGKFNDIQHRANRENGIAEAAKMYPVIFHAFDIISVKGQLVTSLRLDQRKQLLNAIITPNPTVEIEMGYTDGTALFAMASQQGWEGVVGKRMSSPYLFGARGEDWIKVKVLKRGVFWVVGYTNGTGWRKDTFGAMILAKFGGTNTAQFVPVGEVGTGFDQQELERLNAILKSTELPAGSPAYFPYSTPPTGPAVWVKPFQVKIEYLELTKDGRLRFPSYKGTI